MFPNLGSMGRHGRATLRLLMLDLDRTVWDHPDVTSTSPPYVKVGDHVVDGRGEHIRLLPGVPDLFRWAASHGVALAAVSWNDPAKALAVLDAFSLTPYFRYLYIEPHPMKHVLIGRLIERYVAEGGPKNFAEMLYIDDKDVHVYDVWRYVGPVPFLQLGRDLADYRVLLSWLGRGLDTARFARTP